MTRSAVVNSEEEKDPIHNHNQEGMLTTPDSLLPSSEPPDINNWFSSYEYESFVLETNDNFGFSDTQSNCQKEVVDSSSIPKPRPDLLLLTNDDQHNNQVSDSPSLSPVDEESEPPPGIQNWFSSYAYESPPLDTIDDLLSDHTLDSNEEQQQQRNKGENLNDLICNQTVEEHDDNGSSKNSTELPPTHSADLNSPATSLEANENGFVTVKSRRERLIRGNVKRAPCTSSVNDSIKGDDAKKVQMKRKTLSDVTNINAEHLPSVTGKWKCPRKSKPDTGPPLKQLRLGQWFHHQ